MANYSRHNLAGQNAGVASHKQRLTAFLEMAKSAELADTQKNLPNYDIRAPSKAYVITLGGVAGLSTAETALGPINNIAQIGEFKLSYQCTLFNRTAMNGQGLFYGRTYTSPGMKLIQSQGDPSALDVVDEDFIFLNCNYYDPSSVLIVELIVTRTTAGKQTIVSAGYSELALFQFTGAQMAPVVRGTPRTLLSGGSAINDVNKKGGARTHIKFECRESPQYNALKDLLFYNQLCGVTERLPGVAGDRIPVPRAKPTEQYSMTAVKNKPFTLLYIHNMTMCVTKSFEDKFINFLHASCCHQNQVALGTPEAQMLYSQIAISNRTIQVSCSNGWKDLAGKEYPITLDSPDHNQICHGRSSVNIPRYIADSGVGICYKVVYSAMLPIDRTTREFHYTIGWDVVLPGLNAENSLYDQKVDFFLRMGPGISKMRDVLWAQSAQDMDAQAFQIKLTGDIGTSKKAPDASHVEPLQDRLINQNIAIKKGEVAGRMPDHTYMQHINDIHAQEPYYPQSQLNNPGYTTSNEAPMAPSLGKAYNNRTSGYPADVHYKHQPSAGMEGIPQYTPAQSWQQTEGLSGMPGSAMQMTADPKMQQQFMQMEGNINDRFNNVQQLNAKTHDEVKALQLQIQKQQEQKEKKQAASQKMGIADYELQSRQQIEMIGNVFYNMLNLVGQQRQEPQLLSMGQQVKQMLQTRPFEDLQGPKVAQLKAGGINLLKVIDVPPEDQQVLMKMGYADILKGPGSTQMQATTKKAIDMNLEKQDSLSACTIQMRFVAFKAPNGRTSMSVPKRLYFQLRFFSFPELQTDPVSLTNPALGSAEVDNVKPGSTYYLARDRFYESSMGRVQAERATTLHDQELLNVTFDIDSSISKVANEHMKLAQYMKESMLNVDIFDADSQFLYAQAKIPLFDLVRQMKPSVVRAKECEIAAPDSTEFRGYIQMIMSNQGHQPKSQTYDADLDAAKKRGKQPGQGSAPEKRVHSKPMDLSRMQQTNNPLNEQLHGTHNQNPNAQQSLQQERMKGGRAVETLRSHKANTQPIIDTLGHNELQASTHNADLRKKLRVDRVRKMQMQARGAISVEDPNQPDWLKTKSLKEIEIIRETKKHDIVRQVLGESGTGTDVKTLAVTPGELAFLSLPIANKLDQTEVFSVRITDPDMAVLGNIEPELQMVTDAAELSNWVYEGYAQKPPQWNAISRNGDITLQGGASTSVFFKFLTRREATTQTMEYPTRDKCKSRRIQIVIMTSRSGVYQHVEVNVLLSYTPIDHVFRFHEPEESHYSVAIPPFLTVNNQMQFYPSNPDCIVNVDNHGNLTVSGKTDEAMMVQSTLIYVFGDRFLQNLLTTISVEVMARQVIYTRVRVGTQSQHTLSLPGHKARAVKLYSNKPEEVYQLNNSTNDKQTQSPQIRLVPNSTNHISITVCFKQHMNVHSPTLINCVDCNTGELVYSWLMVIETVA